MLSATATAGGAKCPENDGRNFRRIYSLAFSVIDSTLKQSTITTNLRNQLCFSNG